MCIYIYDIYVAFGEHPAAGGLYMFFGSLWHFASLWCLFNTFGGFLAPLWHLGLPF